ncbi:MAG: hypothetical protein J6T70_10460 [Bacteroidales bacterium]|nr:hypothetical protein [Bacteroidales bacterium]
MTNRIIQIIVLIMLFVASCSQKTTTLYDYCNQLNISDTNMLINNELDSSLLLNKQRNIVYLLNAHCAPCIERFIYLIKNINNYRFDSLLVVAGYSYDLVNINFYMKKKNLSLPQNTRIIFDPTNKICVEKSNIYGDDDIFLIEDKRILYKNNTYCLKYDTICGYVIELNN